MTKRADTGSQRHRYQRAELSFLRWEIERGVLNGLDLKQPGSPWWRAVSDRLLGDPRRSSVGVFLDLRNVFPESYPLDDWPLEELIRAEGRLARALAYGIISSRLAELYEFAALSLEEPRVCTFVSDGTPWNNRCEDLRS